MHIKKRFRVLDNIKNIESLIEKGDVDQALNALSKLLDTDYKEKDLLYYLRGNIYRKKSDWHKAMNDYQKAIDLNPESPAIGARDALVNILNFYNKDMYNQ